MLIGWVLLATSVALFVSSAARILRANAGYRIAWWRRSSQDRTDFALSFVSVLCFGVGYALVGRGGREVTIQAYVALGMLVLAVAVVAAFSWHNHLVARQPQAVAQRRPRPY